MGDSESQMGKAAALKKKRDRIRSEMGGAEKINKIHQGGAWTARERIDKLCDQGSFIELGTFARSSTLADYDKTPGDGKISGLGLVDARPIAVVADDITVKRASSAKTGTKRYMRLYKHAIRHGQPFIFFGETGGGRLPEALNTGYFVQSQPGPEMGQRAREIPWVTVITGSSFGGSSFFAAFADFVVQIRGSAMAVSSPRVIEVATGENVGFEELGGVEVHDRLTGQIDRVAENEEDAITLVKNFLSYLPSNAWQAPPRAAWDSTLKRNETLYDLVPASRSRAYDMRRVVKEITDDGRLFELKPNFGRSLITGLTRIAGQTVGIIASNPMFHAGALTPDACDKGTSFLCLCDAFNIPLVFLQDTPGFMVGKQVEHNRLASRAMMFCEALMQTRVPRLTVVIRKAFGQAFYNLNGCRMGAESIVAWPGAQISFMDPEVGVNIIYAEEIAKHADPISERKRLAEAWAQEIDAEKAAAVMEIDEIIDPAETRSWLCAYIDRMTVAIPQKGDFKPLAFWPTCL